jgi:hypothetical protein
MVRLSALVTVVAAIAAAMTVSPAAEHSTGALRQPIELRFSFSTRQPIVPIRVNDHPPAPFILDTGASIHIVDAGLARRVGLSAADGRALTGGGQRSETVHSASNVTLAAPGIVWERQQVTTSALGFPEQKHFAGLLGAPVLRNYAVQFDFPNTTVRFYDPADYRPPPGAVVLPFELAEDLPVIRITVDAGGGPIGARLMIDTGAGTFIDLNRPFVEAHRLERVLADGAARDRPAAIGGAAPFVYGTGRRVTLGAIQFDRPRLGLSRAIAGSSARADRDGIIGNALLQAFRVTFDYRRRSLVLERAGSRKPLAHPEARNREIW